MVGGTGLIGTAITRQLLERGDTVTVFGRGGTPPRYSTDGVRFLTGDRKDYAAFERQMREAGTFDCVIDMICYTPAEAESAVRAFSRQTGHYIFTSTVDVYSKPAGRYPITEREPRRGNNAYGSNKILCEDIFTAAHERGDLNVTIIRPAATYGEGGQVVDTFGWGTTYLDRMRRGLPIIVHGDGSSLWVACHIDDAARAYLGATGNPQTFGKAYHVTGEEWLTWNRYYEQMAEAAGAPPPTLVHIPTDVLVRLAPERAAVTAENFQGNNVFDNSPARADLGFRYTIPWREGVARAIAWLDANGKIAPAESDPIHDRILTAWANALNGMESAVNKG
jgi:nucleoside-diphosphate-sugar epimerase